MPLSTGRMLPGASGQGIRSTDAGTQLTTRAAMASPTVDTDLPGMYMLYWFTSRSVIFIHP